MEFVTCFCRFCMHFAMVSFRVHFVMGFRMSSAFLSSIVLSLGKSRSGREHQAKCSRDCKSFLHVVVHHSFVEDLSDSTIVHMNAARY